MKGKTSLKKIICAALGCLSVVLGAIGAVLPILPSVPFLMLAAICFAKSSDKLDSWFKGTKLYKDNLESFVNGQGMCRKAKIRVMITLTLIMSLGFFMMFRKNLYIPCTILGFVWLFHILYFCFGVKNYLEV